MDRKRVLKQAGLAVDFEDRIRFSISEAVARRIFCAGGEEDYIVVADGCQASAFNHDTARTYYAVEDAPYAEDLFERVTENFRAYHGVNGPLLYFYTRL